MKTTARMPGIQGIAAEASGAGDHVHRLLSLAHALTAAATHAGKAGGVDGPRGQEGSDTEGAALVTSPFGMDLGSLSDRESILWARDLESLNHFVQALITHSAQNLSERVHAGRFEAAGSRNSVSFLSQTLLISNAEANRRLRLAEAFLPHHDLVTGVETEVPQATLGAAFFRGEISGEQALTASGFIHDATDLSDAGRIPREERERVEKTLTDYASEESPDYLRRVGTRILAHLDPDGQEPTQGALLAKQGIFFRQPRRGLVGFDGHLTIAQYEQLMVSIQWATNPRGQLAPEAASGEHDSGQDVSPDEQAVRRETPEPDAHEPSSFFSTMESVMGVSMAPPTSSEVGGTKSPPRDPAADGPTMPGKPPVAAPADTTDTVPSYSEQQWSWSGPPPGNNGWDKQKAPAGGETLWSSPDTEGKGRQVPEPAWPRDIASPDQPADTGWHGPASWVDHAPDEPATLGNMPNSGDSSASDGQIDALRPTDLADSELPAAPGSDPPRQQPRSPGGDNDQKLQGGFAIPEPGSGHCPSGLDPIDSTSSDAAVQDRRTHAQRLLGGLLDCVTIAARTGQLPANGGLKTQLIITTTHEDMARQRSDGTGAAETPYCGPVPLKGFDTALCDAEVTHLYMGKGRQILDVGRTQRLFTFAQRKILLARDMGCAFPDCTTPAYWCEAHHIVPWQEGGGTSVDNGCLLCSYHHHLVHRTEWSVRLRKGTPCFTPPYLIDPTQTERRNSYHHGLASGAEGSA